MSFYCWLKDGQSYCDDAELDSWWWSSLPYQTGRLSYFLMCFCRSSFQNLYSNSLSAVHRALRSLMSFALSFTSSYHSTLLHSVSLGTSTMDPLILFVSISLRDSQGWVRSSFVVNLVGNFAILWFWLSKSSVGIPWSRQLNRIFSYCSGLIQTVSSKNHLSHVFFVTCAQTKAPIVNFFAVSWVFWNCCTGGQSAESSYNCYDLILANIRPLHPMSHHFCDHFQRFPHHLVYFYSFHHFPTASQSISQLNQLLIPHIFLLTFKHHPSFKYP